MKKVYFYSFASALLLASAAGLSSCSADSAEGTGGEPTGSRDVVKTQFAINLPYAGDNSTGTRMSDTNTQNKKGDNNYNNFRGIENMILLAFKGDPGTEGNGTATKLINIGSGNNAYSKGVYTSLYRDIEIPVGTTHFIMNGRAMRTALGKTSESSNFEIGKITAPDDYSNITELSKLNFSLTPIQSDANFANNDAAQAIKTQLDALAAVQVKDGDGDDQQTIKWSSLTGDKNGEKEWPSWISEQERKYLAERYTRFTSLTAGSKASVVAAITNLRDILVGGTTENSSTTSTSTISDSKKLTKAIYEQCNTALTALNSQPQFPRNLDLPDGVAKLSCSNGVFSYVSANDVNIGQGNNINYNKICYPAEISYFVKTKAMVSNEDISAVSQLPDYATWLSKPTDTNTWNGKNFTEGAVSTTTKSVALQLPIQYSVACLKTSVVCSSAKLKDNTKDILDPDKSDAGIVDADIDVPETGFKVRAVLVGGQPGSVNWEFYPASESFDHTIYDKDMNATSSDTDGKYMAATTSSSNNYNYTLVMDNKKTVSGEEKQSKVYVTIELENGTTSFYGKDGLVPANGRFYLVGELDPSADKGVTKPTEGSTIDRVFLQDHTTIANFKITSLKNAYNCIPDLRTAGVNVGLAVDLEWQQGLTFDVDL